MIFSGCRSANQWNDASVGIPDGLWSKCTEGTGWPVAGFSPDAGGLHSWLTGSLWNSPWYAKTNLPPFGTCAIWAPAGSQQSQLAWCHSIIYGEINVSGTIAYTAKYYFEEDAPVTVETRTIDLSTIDFERGVVSNSERGPFDPQLLWYGVWDTMEDSRFEDPPESSMFLNIGGDLLWDRENLRFGVGVQCEVALELYGSHTIRNHDGFRPVSIGETLPFYGMGTVEESPVSITLNGEALPCRFYVAGEEDPGISDISGSIAWTVD